MKIHASSKLLLFLSSDMEQQAKNWNRASDEHPSTQCVGGAHTQSTEIIFNCIFKVQNLPPVRAYYLNMVDITFLTRTIIITCQ